MRKSLFYFIILVLAFTACKDQGASSGNSDSTDSTDTALKQINNKISEDTTNSSLYYNRARYYYNNNSFNLAIKDIERAIQKDSTVEKYWHTYADILMENYESKKAIEVMDTATEIFYPSDASRIKLARMQFIVKQYLPALQNLNTVIKRNPQNPVAFFEKARIYDEVGDTANAMKNYQQATKLNADMRRAWLAQGDILSAQGKDLAVRMYQNAIDINPRNESTYLTIANHFHQNNKLEKAKKEYLEIMQRFPQYPAPHFNLGLLYLEQDSVEKAYNSFDATAKVDPANGSAYLYRGISSKVMGDTAAARKDFKQADRLLPEDDDRPLIELQSIE